MSDGIINDLRGSMEQQSEPQPLSVILQQPNSAVLLDPWRVSLMTGRRYRNEEDVGKSGTSHVNAPRLFFYLSQRWKS